MGQVSELDESIWDDRDLGPGAIPWPDLDTNGERAARVEYMGRKNTGGGGGGYSLCYRCERTASTFVQLRISSRTPVCLDHLPDLTYAKDQHGAMVESGPYLGES